MVTTFSQLLRNMYKKNMLTYLGNLQFFVFFFLKQMAMYMSYIQSLVKNHK